MKNPKLRLPMLALLLCGTLGAAPAWAAPTTDPAELAALAARHRQERATCMNLDAAERSNCVWNANLAYAYAKWNRASDIDPPFAQNVLRRCDPLPGAEQRDCRARTNGKGTTAGSVSSGGMYRELIVIETGAAPMPSIQLPRR